MLFIAAIAAAGLILGPPVLTPSVVSLAPTSALIAETYPDSAADTVRLGYDVWDDIPSSNNPALEATLKKAAARVRAAQEADEAAAAADAARAEKAFLQMQETKAKAAAKEAARAEAAAAARAAADAAAESAGPVEKLAAPPLLGEDSVERVVTREGGRERPACPWCS